MSVNYLETSSDRSITHYTYVKIVFFFYKQMRKIRTEKINSVFYYQIHEFSYLAIDRERKNQIVALNLMVALWSSPGVNQRADGYVIVSNLTTYKKHHFVIL